MRLQLPPFDQARVLVVGDLMLDRYWSGQATRISPEAPVPVVRVSQVEDRLGGAANVAMNLARLQVKTHVMGMIGDDEAGMSLRCLLDEADIGHSLMTLPGLPTTMKLRVMARHQQLMRMDFEQVPPVGQVLPLADGLRELLPRFDFLVLSDYGKGTLANVHEFISLARDAGIKVLVDPKGKDFARYAGAFVLTPNLAEFEAVVGACPHDDQLIARGERLRAELDLEALLITLSERGMLLLRAGRDPLHLPTRAREVFDVTGAGDTVIAVLAAALAAGQDLAAAAALANLAAGIVVGKLGTGHASPAELEAAVRRQAGGPNSLLDETQLMLAVADARGQGERIVMTNGCFDILHAGHVSYLEQARKLGDRLIVAVNDDASVRRLKGEARPVNSLERRMAVLAGLASVDWVVSFAEDTPERLIGRVLPDVLVKGGDYQPGQIAGGDCVRAAGGRVEILPFVAGLSTTDMINRIQSPRSAASTADRPASGSPPQAR